MKTLLLIVSLFSFALFATNTEIANIEIGNSIVKVQDGLITSVESCGPSYAILKRGPRGGCYYVNRNGNKSYVNRACCN